MHACAGKLAPCGQCKVPKCTSCLAFALVSAEAYAKGGAQASCLTTCEACMKALSPLDFSSTAPDVLGPKPGIGPTAVFVHGGGGCRLMFRPHAEALAALGVRCVLLDLPGHGTRMGNKLSMASAIEAILSDTAQYAPPTAAGLKPVLIGGSLGGYIGMELLGRSPDVFSGAVIAMCGQNVGVGRSCAASLGMLAMDFALPRMRPASLLDGMRREVKKNGHLSDALLEGTIRPGFFFGQGGAQVAIMRESDPRSSLPRFEGRTLFVNGSKDHRDSEGKWVAASALGRLKVYEGADHFFSHDTRFCDAFTADVAAFIGEVSGVSLPPPRRLGAGSD
jgi:pimeloyl-ACP methyl ester carboxylesterase